MRTCALCGYARILLDIGDEDGGVGDLAAACSLGKGAWSACSKTGVAGRSRVPV